MQRVGARSSPTFDRLIVRDENRDGDSHCDNGSDERLYYTNDANMNVTALIETDGDVAERYVYDPYGKRTIYNADRDDTVDWDDSKKNEILYCGYRWDPESGLYHVRERMYHPTLGRWMQRDPIAYANGVSLYEYAVSSPCGLLDPSGTEIVVLSGGPEFVQATVRGLKALCPCFDGTDNTSGIVAVGNRIGLSETWDGRRKPFNPADGDAQYRFCCKCYLEDAELDKAFAIAWANELEKIKNELAAEMGDPANRYKRHKIKGLGRLHQEVDRLAREVNDAVAKGKGRGRVTGCNLVWAVLVERTIQLRKGTNEYRKREDTVYWEGQGAATALGHELTHGVRGPTPFKGRSDLTDKRRAQLEPGGRFDEREVVQQGENPMRFEAGEPLRTGTHTGMPMVNDWSQLANPSSLLQPSKPKWCGEFKGYVP